MTREKIAAQIIHKEFLEADDANLLEEEGKLLSFFEIIIY